MLIRLRALAGRCLHPQVELLAPQLEQLFGELVARQLSQLPELLFDFFELHQNIDRFVNDVLTDSFAAASVNASRATSSVTPAIS